MAMTEINFPAEGAADWTDFIDMTKDWVIGHIGLGLTNYENTSLPAIAEGSKCEIGGSYWLAASDQAPTGSATNAVLNYIYISTAGAVSWSTTAPTWDDTKQGWYNGTSRAVAGCYFLTSGTIYTAKWIYHDQDSGPQTRHVAIPFVGEVESGTVLPNGGSVSFATNAIYHVPVFLPDGAIVTELYSYGQATTGTVTVNLRNSLHSAATDTTMATTSHSGGSAADTDTTIIDGIVDNTTKAYRIEMSTGGTASGISLTGLRVQYINTRPLT